ncbi:MAG: T9SS type A sorting domain-containing protein [Bacteroidales bacterium]|nr:T9SS type A sorting domain-containing protein [Bacteroidales bacterium]
MALLSGFRRETGSAARNPVLRAYEGKESRLKSAVLPDTLELPFLDDFSGKKPFPNSAYWMDSLVFINDSYAMNPMSVGVATFDALNKYGKIYSHASSRSFGADYLTSKPINLKYPASSDIYLSFYYQPQGLGDMPDATDSLIVDFFNPATQRWSKVWSVKGSKNHPFKAATIPVNADSFLVKGFQFRFRNIASVEVNNDIPGKMGNVDHWHIDYVKLDANRTDHDTIMRDVAFIKQTPSLLRNYQSMPWTHYQTSAGRAGETKTRIEVNYRNNDTIGHKPERYFEIRERTGTDKAQDYWGNENIDPLSDYTFSNNVENYFLSTQTDYAVYEVKTFLETEPYDIKQNDTSTFFQGFYNYYAYDDGTPEYGYAIGGPGTLNGMVAYKFNSYLADTLTAVSMYFNSTIGELTKNYSFKLTVWEAATSSPGKIIYQSPDFLSPEKTGEFSTYKLDTAVIVDGDFYVGWKQPGEDFINIGLDVNNTSMENVFFNTGFWYNATTELEVGAPMIRPVFGKADFITRTKNPEIKSNISIYPNPCSGILNISYTQDIKSNVYATLLSMTGKTVLQTEVSNGTVNLESLPSGLYFLVLTEKGQSIYKGKVLVQQ